MTNLKAPFVYFGGKSMIASRIWQILGSPDHYIEPFFGSGAVLLNRPNYNQNMVETVNDKDCHIANVWRAIKYKPSETAEWCDWPVNHVDLKARRKVLIAAQKELPAMLAADDMYCDVKLAGYWIWAASCWIGNGLTRPNARPRLDGDAGINALGKEIEKLFESLAFRLRRVKVVCGDFMQVLGGNWQNNLGICGIYFDPPYGEKAGRTKNIYAHDSLTVADRVEEYCLKRGHETDYRIVVSGYEGEYQKLIDAGWRVEAWKANGGYSNAGNTKNKENSKKERLFISPHCLGKGLFDE